MNCDIFEAVLKSTQMEERIIAPKKLAKKVNKFFTSLSLVNFEEEELIDGIKNLTDNAQSALLDAVKDKDMNKLISILGLRDILKIRNRR